MKNLYVTVILYLVIILKSAGAELQSSVDSNALCPGERVTFSCTVPSLSHQWRITNGSTSQIIGSVSSGTLSAVGGFGFELTVVDRTATSITSTAMVNTTTDLSGTVIVCRDFLVPLEQAQQQNTTMNITGAPTAPDITMLSESGRTMDRITFKADLQQPVYGFECIQNYTLIARADGKEDVRGVSASPDDLFVLVPGLSVCPRQYTFTALACSSGQLCSVESAPVILNVTDGLLHVNNIVGNGGNLLWNEPQNVPAGCITNYTIMWDDGMFTTPDNRTSIPTDNIPGLEVCRTYTSITVTPNIPPFGAIQSYSGEHLHVTLLPSDFPIPSSLRVEMLAYNGLGITLRLHWNVASQISMDTAVNISVGYSTSMATCSSSVPLVQNVSGSDIPNAIDVLLTNSFIGRETFFCVMFTLNDCERRLVTATLFCTHEDLGDVDVTPDERCPGQQNSAQFTGGVVCYSGLTPGSVAAYVCNSTHHLEGSRFRICQSNGNWSRSAPQCVEDLIVRTTAGLGAGAVVGISITIFLLSFTFGGLLAAFICGLRWRGKSSKQPHASPSEGPQPAPVYAEVEPGLVDILEMKENPAYGPV